MACIKTYTEFSFIQDAFRPKGSPKIGDIWTTVSAITTNGRQTVYGILFAADIQGGLVVGMDDLKFTGVCMQLSRNRYVPVCEVVDVIGR